MLFVGLNFNSTPGSSINTRKTAIDVGSILIFERSVRMFEKHHSFLIINHLCVEKSTS